MKTKFYISLMLAALTLGTTTSCGDFLDEENKVGDTADLAYGTATGACGTESRLHSVCPKWEPMSSTTDTTTSRRVCWLITSHL